MSRVTIRAAMSDYFADAQGATPWITKVFPSLPTVTAASLFIRNPGDQYGAIAETFIRNQADRRISMPAETGIKHVLYEMVLGVKFWFAGDAGEGWPVWDALLDNISARCRANLRANQPDTVVWEFANGDNGSDDIRIETFYPTAVKDQGTLFWGEVWFIVKEEIRA